MSSQGLELISVLQVVWLPSKAPPTTEFLNSSRPACRPGDVLSPWSLAEQSFLVSTGATRAQDTTSCPRTRRAAWTSSPVWARMPTPIFWKVVVSNPLQTLWEGNWVTRKTDRPRYKQDHSGHHGPWLWAPPPLFLLQNARASPSHRPRNEEGLGTSTGWSSSHNPRNGALHVAERLSDLKGR